MTTMSNANTSPVGRRVSQGKMTVVGPHPSTAEEPSQIPSSRPNRSRQTSHIPEKRATHQPGPLSSLRPPHRIVGSGSPGPPPELSRHLTQIRQGETG